MPLGVTSPAATGMGKRVLTHLIVRISHIGQCNAGDWRCSEVADAKGKGDSHPGFPALKGVSKPKRPGHLERNERHKHPEAHLGLVDAVVLPRQTQDDPVRKRSTD